TSHQIRWVPKSQEAMVSRWRSGLSNALKDANTTPHSGALCACSSRNRGTGPALPRGRPATSVGHPRAGKSRRLTVRGRLGRGSEFAVTDLAQPLVGRDRELEVIGQLLREACAGSPRLVFITGEPGIGKTRLLLELLGQAESRGMLALRGRASEFE